MKENKSKKITIFHHTYDQYGRLRTIMQYVEQNRNLNNFDIPVWLVSIFVSIFAAILIALAAALYVYFSKRPALYNESCIGRSCTSGLNMKCINGICTCPSSDYYYQKGCLAKKAYLEQCSSISNNCQDKKNLVCLDGLCKCNNTFYWNSVQCVSKSSFGGPCTNDNQCLTRTKMKCDLTSKTCICDSTRLNFIHLKTKK